MKHRIFTADWPQEQMCSVGFEVFTAMAVKNAVLWDVAPCRSCVNGRFGGTYRLIQGRKNPRSRNQREQVAAGRSAHGFFYPEGGGDTFL
jgi:hypothetical protein